MPETMATIPFDTPRYLEPEHLYGDDEGHVYLYGEERVPICADKPTRTRGQIAVMLAMNGFNVYHVADMRYVNCDIDGDPVEFSPQQFGYWEDASDDGGLPIVGIMQRDPDTGEDSPIGDPGFYDATWHLAQQVDKVRREMRVAHDVSYHFSLAERLLYIPAYRLRETFRPRG